MTLGYKRINVPNVGPTSMTPPTPDFQTPIFSDPRVTSPTEPTPYIGTKYSVTLRLTRDTRDYFLNPTRGRRDSIAVEVSRSDFRLRKAWLSLQQYFPTWRKQTIAVELHGAAAWGVNIPPTELFYLGGATTLRGYDEDWFSGPRRVYANLEYRFLVGPDSQIFVFTDLGTVTLIETPSVLIHSESVTDSGHVLNQEAVSYASITDSRQEIPSCEGKSTLTSARHFSVHLLICQVRKYVIKYIRAVIDVI